MRVWRKNNIVGDSYWCCEKGDVAMKVAGKKECFQALDSIIDKIDLLEATITLQIDSQVRQESEQLLNTLELIELHTNHIENRILFYRDDHVDDEKIIS